MFRIGAPFEDQTAQHSDDKEIRLPTTQTSTLVDVGDAVYRTPAIA